jgi:predicted metal-binding protein
MLSIPRSLLRLVHVLLSLSLLLLNASAYTIQVCQDKNCCKRFTGKASNLVQTLRQLTTDSTDITIEATTCLSHCDRGPNVRIGNDDVENDVTSAASAAAMLELHTITKKVHPTVLAACNVMERAYKGMFF